MMILAEFIEGGGVLRREHEAARQAVQKEREFWLPLLEDKLATADLNAYEENYLAGEIRRLQRMLGIKPTLDRRRTQTRERVRRLRHRRKLVAPPRP